MNEPYIIIGHSTDKDWLKKRKLGIGGSEIAAVMGKSPFSSPFKLWTEKTGKAEPDDLSDNDAVYWGTVLESPVAKRCLQKAKRLGHPSGELLQSVDYPWAIATIDWWTFIPEFETNDEEGNIFVTENVKVPLEVKTTSSIQADKWNDGLPEHIMLQVQHQMLVTGAPMAMVACLFAGQKDAWLDVERDETIINQIIYHGERFWMKVLGDEPPEVTGTEQDRYALSKAYDTIDPDCVVQADDAIEEAHSLLRDMKDQKKLLEAAILLEENKIKLFMGGNQYLLLRDGSQYSRAEITVKPHEVKGSRFIQLRYIKAKG